MHDGAVMNFLKFCPVPAALAFIACNSVSTPVSTSSFDPLRPPGSGRKPVEASSFGPDLSPGQFVNANLPNTAFYKNKPSANQDADTLLKIGTNMKIVEVDGNYVKVEMDSGEVGYVPAVMVTAPDNSSTTDLMATGTPNLLPGATAELPPIDGAYQVYPPLPGGGPIEPLPIIDPGGLPPDGSIPAIIDPSAPVPDPSIPTLDAIPEMKPEVTEAELDPVAEAVRKKVEAAKAEEEAEAAKALKSTPDAADEKEEPKATDNGPKATDKEPKLIEGEE